MQYVDVAWSWMLQHPLAVLLICILVINIVWAQIPKEWLLAHPRFARLLPWTHAVLQLVVTHRDQPGTFTWPYIFKLFLALAANEPVPELPKFDFPASAVSKSKEEK